MTPTTATLACYAYIGSTWTLLDDVAPISGSWGMGDNNPTTRVADVGEMSLALNNESGQYTPGGPSALAGWKKGIPFKAEFTFDGTVARRWRGNITDIQIKQGNKDPLCYITVLDWLDYAARHPIVNPGVIANKRGDEVMTTTTALVSIAPQATDYDTGVETFPTVFDTVTSHTKAYNEFAKVALSELGYVYLKKDATYGEKLVFEAADYRHGWRAVDTATLTTYAVDPTTSYLLKEDGGFLLKEDGGKLILNKRTSTVHTFDGTLDGSIITDFEAPYGEHVINRMTVYANPRKLDTAQVLFTLSSEIVIGSGQTIHLKGTYANPSGGLPCNGQSMIAPDAGTDYTMYTATAGGGSDIKADLVVVTGYGTEGFDHTLTNNNASVGYINMFKCRGTGVYVNNPIEHAATNAASIAEYETESESLNQKYKNDLYSGSVFAESVVDEHRQPRVVLNSISFCANKSDACMMAFLYTDVGSLHYISIPEAGIAGNYYIQGIEFTMSGGIIMVKWIVSVALSLLVGLSPIAVEFNGGVTTDGINFGYLPRVSGDAVLQRSWSVWFYQQTDGPSSPHSYVLMSTFGDLAGTLVYSRTPKVIYFFSARFGSGGRWQSPDNSFTLNAWHHLVITMDDGSALNNPIMYIDGVSVAVTESMAPSGAVNSEVSRNLIIGNLLTSVSVYSEPYDGLLFNPCVYNRILTAADVTTLYNAGVEDETLVTSGLVFQGFNVRTGDTGDYIDHTLTSALTLRDNIYGAVGVVHGSPIGRAKP